jgi:putative serine protease PepD
VKRVLAPIVLSALVGGVVASMAFVVLGTGEKGSAGTARQLATTSTTPGARRDVSSTALSASQVYRRASAGVVSIKAATADGEDEGTGIVLNEAGLILTNDHVIAGARSLTVDASGSSKETRGATIVGEEANQDLALIRVDPSGLGLKPLTLKSSSSVQVGDAVYAIGDPYGLEETLTRGIVSALHRQISAPDGSTITGAIQTDAALNPGNSGGPLLDAQGEVIGVNSQIATDASSEDGSQPGSTGVGFAISANTVAQVVKKINSGLGVPFASAAQSALQSQGRSSEEHQSEDPSPYGSPGSDAESQLDNQSEEVETEVGAGTSAEEAGPGSASYGRESAGVGGGEEEGPVAIVR